MSIRATDWTVKLGVLHENAWHATSSITHTLCGKPIKGDFVERKMGGEVTCKNCLRRLWRDD